MGWPLVLAGVIASSLFMLAFLGFTRVNPRELTIDDLVFLLRDAREQRDLLRELSSSGDEVRVFVNGRLCVSISETGSGCVIYRVTASGFVGAVEIGYRKTVVSYAFSGVRHELAALTVDEVRLLHRSVLYIGELLHLADPTFAFHGEVDA